LAVSDDKIATGSTDKTCRIFDKKSTECQAVISLDFGVCGVFLFGDSVFIGTKDSKGYKYCAKTGTKQLDLVEPADTFTDLGPEHPSSGFKEFCMTHQFGGCIAAANRSAAHLWDVKTGEHLHTLYEADNVDVNALCLAKAVDEAVAGRAFAFTGLDDNTAHMYCIDEPVHGDASPALVTASATATGDSTAAPVASPTKQAEISASQPSSCCTVS